jgi:hypothetical protein
MKAERMPYVDQAEAGETGRGEEGTGFGEPGKRP